MSISHYIKEIGRGKDGARSLTREQAADLMGQLLDGTVTDLEVGAFCLAMRIKGETPAEMAGFLDATHARITPVPAACAESAASAASSTSATSATGPSPATTVVLPSYNGARKLPVLTPLLALLLAREGLAVLVHGTDTESGRISAQNVLHALGVQAQSAITSIPAGSVAFVPTGLLHPGLKRLLDVRRVVGLRNPAHSLVKLMQPCTGPAVLVSSYTHPEYLQSMSATLALTGTRALLLRGTEGEPVADARRTPAMDTFDHGQCTRVQEPQLGPLAQLPSLPATDAASTATWIRSVLAGHAPVPASIALQVQHILGLAKTATAPHALAADTAPTPPTGA